MDTASLQRGEAAYAALLAQGYRYRFSGRLSDINVAMVGGHAVFRGNAQRGDHIDVSFVRSDHAIYEFGPAAARTTRVLIDQCDGCDSASSSSPPRGQSTPPPNYGPCSTSGGATWFNAATGDGGCLGPGGSKGLPCGIWTWYSPGKGRFRSWDGTFDYPDWTYIAVDSDGQTCHLGY